MFIVLLLSVCSAQAATDVLTASGTWTAPAGVTSVDVEVWGGGGGGGGQTSNSDGGGGGGGGAYSKVIGVAVTPGNTYTVTVGAGGAGVSGGTGGSGGDSYFINVTTVLAKGGTGGAPSTGTPPAGGAGGAAVSGVGTTKYSGGTGGRGRNSTTGQGGPGGSSAGTAANGTSGPDPWSTVTAAAAPAGGGIGGNGGTSGNNGAAPASGNGGGGGGSGDGNPRTGGNGAGGKVVVTYIPPPTVTSINTASTNPTAPATAIAWTVVFSTSVTGVNAADFTLVQAGGVTGATITSVTGSGTTWTVNANTGSGTGTLGLNLVDDDTIVDGGGLKLGGTGVGNGNFTGQIYTVSPPLICLTDNFGTGTLDPTLWSVKTILGPYLPQVVNVGGGDYRLRLTNTGGNEATFAQLKRTFPAAGNKVVLEIDYFAYGGSGADGIAVTFSDATISSTTGGFGGSLGYAQNNTSPGYPGFGGGWLGIGLDEWGNYPCNNESRTGYPAGWVDPVLGAGATVCTGSSGGTHYVAIRGSGSGTTGYNLLANTGVITATAPASGAAGATPYRYRFTLDHSDSVHAYVTVERDTTGTGSSYTTLVPKFDVKASSVQAAVPANWLVSFTGSTGGSTNNHELKQVKVCANTIVGGGPDHLEIDASSATGLTCTPSTLTIKACADAACTTAYTGGVTGTLSASGAANVNWSGGSSFSISAIGTVNKDVQVTTPNIPVTFNAVSTPAASYATICNFGGSTNCQFTAADAGFLVSAPNHTSETTSTLSIEAVKSGVTTSGLKACVPAFASTSKTVNLKCAYSNPATGTLPVRIGGTPLNATANAASACDGTGANVTLSFDATGIATPSLQYADVGQMNVSAAYAGIAGSLDAGLSMTGTGSFIAAPNSFSFSGLPAGPIKAGNSFSATVSALNNSGAVTPNFGKESIPGPEGVTLTANLVTPNLVTFPAASHPNPGNNIIPGSEFGAGGMVNDANGVATVNNLSWSEVGSITLKAGLTSASYLGSGLNPTGTSATVGAFIPDHFDTAVIATATTPMPCPTGLTCPAVYNGFVYSGQPFIEQVTAMYLLADGTTTGPTKNYHGAYGLSNNVTLTAWDALGSVITQNPPGGANAGALANTMLASTAFINGVGTTNTQAYTFATSPTSPTDIFLRAVDAVNTTVTSRRAAPATSVEGGVKVVSGKVKISNANGSELLPLTLTATVQYWNSASWVTSTTDSITQFNTNLSTAGGNIVATILNGLGSGVSVATPGMVTVASGVNPVNTFTLNKPGIVGSADISLNAPGYLLGGSNGAGINPSKAGRATFGVYKGPSEFIYLHENY